MKFKDKEKLWLSRVKEMCKADKWKYKSHFIFKSADNLFFSSTFYVSRLENEISGWLGYKTLNIDNVFWDIIDELPNKLTPLSFRGNAVFCVRQINFLTYKVGIEDLENPDIAIHQMLDSVNENVAKKLSTIRTLFDFQNDLLSDERNNCVGIVVGYIENKQVDLALMKIKEYRSKGYNSGFKFEGKDFYDLAIEYCKKNYL